MVSTDEAKVTHDKAEITLISYMLKSVKRGAKFVCVFSDHTYVFILLVYWTWKCKMAVDIQMENGMGPSCQLTALLASVLAFLLYTPSPVMSVFIVIQPEEIHACYEANTYPYGNGIISTIITLEQCNISRVG